MSRARRLARAHRSKATPRQCGRPTFALATTLAVGLALVFAGACAPEDSSEPTEIPAVDGDALPSGWRAPSGPCQLDPETPSTLVLTTTDFVAGSIATVDLADATVQTDVANSTSDAVPFAHAGRVLVVHRYQHDRLDVLDPDGWSLEGQHGLPPTSAPSSNPHSVAVGPDGLAYVTLFAEPTLRVLDLSQPAAQAEVGRIDLSAFDPVDRTPEASLAVTCGDLVLVTAQRLDPGFIPKATDLLIAVDPASQQALDLSPETEAVDGLPLLGEWVRQLRRDPADPEGLTLLGLSRGIERIELKSGRRSWAVTPEAFAEVGIDERLLPQAFDVDSTGARAYLAAYDPDFSQVRLYRVGLDGRAPAVPEPFAEGFDSVERSLELVGDDLWYGSTRVGAEGLWRFDTRTDPPAVLAGPLPTGLPPYSMVAIP